MKFSNHKAVRTVALSSAIALAGPAIAQDRGGARTDTGMSRGLDRGMSRGLDTGMPRGLDNGMGRGLDSGMSRGLDSGQSRGMDTGRRGNEGATVRTGTRSGR